METKNETNPQEPMVTTEPHIAGEIAGGVLIASVIVASVSLWAVGFVNLITNLA